ncbi:MAG: AroM family protein [Firmicutes bacterium]|nr:AroM family protein [Bacillota bacterium]
MNDRTCRTVAAVTIGQTPREDIVPELRRIMGIPEGPRVESIPPRSEAARGECRCSASPASPRAAIQIVEFGALDGLSDAEVAALAPTQGEELLVTRLRTGRSVQVSERKLYPLVEAAVRRAKDQADAIILLCTGSFDDLESNRPLLRPDRILMSTALAVVGDGILGVLTPDRSQACWQAERWEKAARAAGLGTTVVVEAASPFGVKESVKGNGGVTSCSGTEVQPGPGLTHTELREAARALAQCDVVVMDCMGYDLSMKEVAREASGRPVMLARSVLARVAAEVVL